MQGQECLCTRVCDGEPVQMAGGDTRLAGGRSWAQTYFPQRPWRLTSPASFFTCPSLSLSCEGDGVSQPRSGQWGLQPLGELRRGRSVPSAGAAMALRAPARPELALARLLNAVVSPKRGGKQRVAGLLLFTSLFLASCLPGRLFLARPFCFCCHP